MNRRTVLTILGLVACQSLASAAVVELALLLGEALRNRQRGLVLFLLAAA